MLEIIGVTHPTINRKVHKAFLKETLEYEDNFHLLSVSRKAGEHRESKEILQNAR